MLQVAIFYHTISDTDQVLYVENITTSSNLFLCFLKNIIAVDFMEYNYLCLKDLKNPNTIASYLE